MLAARKGYSSTEQGAYRLGSKLSRIVYRDTKPGNVFDGIDTPRYPTRMPEAIAPNREEDLARACREHVYRAAMRAPSYSIPSEVREALAAAVTAGLEAYAAFQKANPPPTTPPLSAGLAFNVRVAEACHTCGNRLCAGCSKLEKGRYTHIFTNEDVCDGCAGKQAEGTRKGREQGIERRAKLAYADQVATWLREKAWKKPDVDADTCTVLAEAVLNGEADE